MVFHYTYLLSIYVERKRGSLIILLSNFVVKEKKNGQLLEGMVGSRDDFSFPVFLFLKVGEKTDLSLFQENSKGGRKNDNPKERGKLKPCP